MNTNTIDILSIPTESEQATAVSAEKDSVHAETIRSSSSVGSAVGGPGPMPLSMELLRHRVKEQTYTAPFKPWVEQLSSRTNFRYFVTLTTDPKRGLIHRDADEYMASVEKWIANVTRLSINRSAPDQLWFREKEKTARPASSRYSRGANTRRKGRNRAIDPKTGISHYVGETTAAWEDRCKTTKTILTHHGPASRRLRSGRGWPDWIVAIEQTKKGGLHAHLLLTGEACGCKLDFGTMHNEWFRDHGYIFIEDIDDQDGAVGYTTKCIRYAMKNQCLAYDDPRRKQENDPHPMTAFKLSRALIKQ